MLKKLFEKILCLHTWELLKEIPVFDSDEGYHMPIYHKYILTCIKCGKIKKLKT